MRTATIDESAGALTAPPMLDPALDPAGDPAGVDRAVWSARSLFHLALLFLTIFGLSRFGVQLSDNADGVSTIWFSNGILFAIVIRKPPSTWWPYALVGYTADTLGTWTFGTYLPIAIGVTLANSIEIFLAAFVLTRQFGSPLQLSRPRPLFGFLALAVLAAPALTSSLATSWILLFIPGNWWTTCRTWYLGDVLGMAIMAPLVYTIQEPGFFTIFRRRQLTETLLTLAAPTLAALLEFSQQREPVIFLIFPALVFVAFRRGFPGTVVAIALIACIGIALTITGHGPMMLDRNPNILHRIVVVQIFLAVALFTAFPIAALLEERASLELSLQQREVQFRELANTDSLTGQGNRRAFDERLQTEWKRSTRPLALLSIDVDLFKSYNDIYGHIAGDDCLRRIASIAAHTLRERSTARLYRLGGEEFAAILPGADAAESFALAERIREAILAANIEHSGSPLGRQTVSIGVATTLPTPGLASLSLLSLSDQALYNAKHNGRNRCEAAT